MDRLSRKIKDRIEREGPITFAAFMEMALYHPGLGYYTSESTEIGKSGDFYTSPHLHPVFGAMLGRQVEEMWEAMGRPAGFDLVEFGGGRGYLCKDMLDYLRDREIFQRLSYAIVEFNPQMARRQEKLLGEHLERVRWVSSPAELGQVRGCVLSNEVLDALPVHLIEMEEGIREIRVSFDENGFREESGPPSTEAIGEYLREFSPLLPQGYRTEVNLAMGSWLKDVSGLLKEGFVLTIDYGYSAQDYYSEERTRGTLICYHRHRLVEDPLINVGSQDITAHINFSALKKWGEHYGLKPLGFAGQGAYLVSLGIDEMMTELYGKSPDYAFEAARIKGLILPGAMGESHKVMVQHKGEGRPALRGFAMKNRLGTL